MNLTPLRKGLEYDAAKAIVALKTNDDTEFAKLVGGLIGEALDKFVYMTEEFNGTHAKTPVTETDRERLAVGVERMALLETLRDKAYKEMRDRGLYSTGIFDFAEERTEWLEGLISSEW